ncbi:hypothetical protein ACFQ8C_32655 [Streptomyces sp. NPDC056503]|uniref:hypothetical protein n=1 Tax=Streptomyces sp. NPDC056503 TaxID=3345842 RepID=UPI0036D16C96
MVTDDRGPADPFGGLDTLDLAGHVRRWSGALPASGAVSGWQAAAQFFARRLADEGDGLTDERWAEASGAWAALLAAAERGTGAQQYEWVMRDLTLTALLLERLGPLPSAPLRDPARLLDLALDSLPLDLGRARELAGRWRELPREEILALRTAKRLLHPPLTVEPLLTGLGRKPELDAWKALRPALP